MLFMNYALAALISFLGLPSGIFLAFAAKEELKIGKRYFLLMQNILLVLILFFLMEHLRADIYLTVLISITLLVLLFYFNNGENTKKLPIAVYPALAVVFYLSSKNTNLFLLESALIFMYGLPAGSLVIDLKKKDYAAVILKHISFVVVALLLFFILS